MATTTPEVCNTSDMHSFVIDWTCFKVALCSTQGVCQFLITSSDRSYFQCTLHIDSERNASTTCRSEARIASYRDTKYYASSDILATPPVSPRFSHWLSSTLMLDPSCAFWLRQANANKRCCSLEVWIPRSFLRYTCSQLRVSLSKAFSPSELHVVDSADRQYPGTVLKCLSQLEWNTPSTPSG